MTAAASRGVLRVDAADLVATAGAGATLEALDAAFAARGVWLALDPPGPRTRTLGESLGSGTPGPLAALFGPPRDQVIGLKFTAGAGTSVRTGGRVVKNVAGFDLAKLVIGGHGAFGRIDEAHLRLRARPEADLTRTWSGSRDRITRAAARLMHAGSMLASLEVTSGSMTPGTPPHHGILAARALGTGVGVAEELDAAAAQVGDDCAEIFGPGDYWAGWRDRVGAWPVSARIGADPARWHDALALAERFGATAFSATVPRGTVRVAFAPGDADALRALRAAAAVEGWPVTIEHADNATLHAVGVWGAMPAGTMRLARALRAALGPEGTHDVPLWADEWGSGEAGKWGR